MDNRSTVQAFWRAARGGMARLHQLLAEGDPSDGAIFQTRSRGPEKATDSERRIAEAKKARTR